MPIRETLECVDRWIHTIYQATGSEARWNHLLDQLGGMFEAPRSAIVEQDFFANKARIKFSSGFQPKTTTAYIERFMAENPWLRDRDRYRPGLAWTGREAVPHAQLVQLDFYKEYLAPLDAFHRLCGTVARDDSEVVYLAFYRGRGSPCFSNSETRFLARLLPHIAQALQLHESLLHARNWHETYLHLIDRLPVAVFLVEGDGTLLLANSKAEALLGENCGVRISQRRFTASRQADARQFRRVLGRLSTVPRDTLDGQIEHVAVTRDEGRHPLMLSISPVSHGSGPVLGKKRSLALITTRDPDHVETLGPCRFGDAYGLTGAENRLSRLILEGYSLVDAATRLRISHNTARSHMKSIYAKTGAHRQADLIHLHAKTCTDHY